MNGVVFHAVNLSNSHHVLGNDPYIENTVLLAWGSEI